MKKTAIILIALLLCIAMSSLGLGKVKTAVPNPSKSGVDTVASATPSYYRNFSESYLKTLPLTGGYYFCQKASSPYGRSYQDWYGLSLANLLDQEVGLPGDATVVTLYADDFDPVTKPDAYVELDLNTRVRNPNADGMPSILAWKKYATTNVDLNDPESPLLTILDSTSEGPFRLALGQYPNVGPYNPDVVPPLNGSPNYNLFLKMVRTIKVGPVSGVPDVDVDTVADNQLVVYGNIEPYRITDNAPTSGYAGNEVTVNGFGFGSIQGTSTVTFGGIAAEVVSWGCKQIKCKVPAGLTTGPVDVTVTTDNDGTSNAVPFEVTEVPPAPTVTSVSPSKSVNLNLALQLTVTGTGFQTGATVRMVKGATTLTPTAVNVVSDTQITCTFKLTSVSVGMYDFFVTNPDAQEGKWAQQFAVTNLCGTGAAIPVVGFGLVIGLLSIAGAGGSIRRRRRRKD